MEWDFVQVYIKDRKFCSSILKPGEKFTIGVFFLKECNYDTAACQGCCTLAVTLHITRNNLRQSLQAFQEKSKVCKSKVRYDPRRKKINCRRGSSQV